ncbi:MAG: D-aminoacylase [Novibacillus thermophilus]
MLDYVLKNGRIVDGTGNPWFIGDIAIKDGRIVQVGRVETESKEEIDVGQHIISPGFIDGHCHSDLMILDHPDSRIKLEQGVTTEVVGNCGLAPAPFFPQFGNQLQAYVEPVLGKTNREWNWHTVEDYMNVLASVNPSENVSTYVAHGALRIAVMGFEKRPARPAEVEKMKVLLEDGLKAGAIGLSIGLLYAPGSYTSKEELAELCTVLSKYNGLLATHVRGEGNNLVPSIQEVLWIAEKSGVQLHISHLKAAGKRNWGKVLDAIEIIEDARNRGMDVTCDVYPYSAGSTMLTTLLPPWSLEGGIQRTIERLKDKVTREEIKNELNREQEDWDNLVASTGWESVFVSSVQTSKNKVFEGKNIADISRSTGKDPIDQMMDLLIEEFGNVSIVFFHMSDTDLKSVIKYDKSLIASDSLTCSTGKPHPRLFGTFPRIFSKYVREEKILKLEDAVRKMTSFPAKRFNLGKRGLLVPGYIADITVFDEDRIADRATYEHPTQYPDGISYVFVNGTKTKEFNTYTKRRSGKVVFSETICVDG